MWFLFLLACFDPAPVGDDTAVVERSALELPDLSGKNLVYVHVDTLRADHLPFYGYARMTTPTMAERDWLVMDGLYGASSWTVPSTGSLLTAQPPEVHGLTELGTDPDNAYLTLDVPTVAEHLHDGGWATASISGNVWITQRTEMINGFDLTDHIPKRNEQYNLLQGLDVAWPWLDALPEGQPFFLFLQPMDMHIPYWVAPDDRGYWGEGEPPFDLDETDHDVQSQQISEALRLDEEAATQAMRDVYDTQIVGLDRGVGALLDGLEARGLLADTLVVFGGDHGETLNDAGDRTWGHSRWLREELVHNPLMFLSADISPGEVSCIAPNRDVMPTLLAALGQPPMEGAAGQSLAAGCHAFAISQLYTDPTTLKEVNASDGRERVTRSCEDRRDQGWDLVNDPTQVSPVGVSELEKGAALRQGIEEEVARVTAAIPGTNCLW